MDVNLAPAPGSDQGPTPGRRRAVVIGAGLAAAAAIVVPLAVLALHDSGPGDGSATVPSPQPSASPSDTPADYSPSASASETHAQPSPSPAGQALPWRVVSLATGQPPAVPYVVDSVVHSAGQPTWAVPPMLGQLARMSDGRWLARTVDLGTGVTAIELRADDGTVVDRFPAKAFAWFALSPSAATAVWWDEAGDVVALQAGGTAPTRVGSLPASDAMIRAVRGPDCATSCVISGRAMDSDTGWEMTQDGEVTGLGNGLDTVSDTSDDSLAVGLTKLTDDGSCWALVDLARETTLWSTCENTLDAFSPDGSLVLASEAYHDGWGSSEVAVYDTATGVRLLDLLRAGDTFTGYQSASWEDDSHLLVTTYADDAWAVVRIGVDGTMEYAVPPVPGDEMENPFLVVGR